MFTTTYVPGKGYTVRDVRGKVVAHSLSPVKKDQLMAHQYSSVLSAAVLAAIVGA